MGGRDAKTSPTRPRWRGVWRWLAALVCLWACDVPAAPPPAAEMYQLESLGLVLTTRQGGGFAALRADTGAPVWMIPGMEGVETPIGTYRAKQLQCPPQVTADARLLLAYPRLWKLLDGRSGEVIWKRVVVGFVPCPVVTRDSGLLGYEPAGERGWVFKLAPDGTEQWRRRLPQIGPVTAPLRASLATGHFQLRSHSHVVDLKGDGSVGWVRPIAELGSGAAAP